MDVISSIRTAISMQASKHSSQSKKVFSSRNPIHLRFHFKSLPPRPNLISPKWLYVKRHVSTFEKKIFKIKKQPSEIFK